MNRYQELTEKLAKSRKETNELENELLRLSKTDFKNEVEKNFLNCCFKIIEPVSVYTPKKTKLYRVTQCRADGSLVCEHLSFLEDGHYTIKKNLVITLTEANKIFNVQITEKEFDELLESVKHIIAEFMLPDFPIEIGEGTTFEHETEKLVAIKYDGQHSEFRCFNCYFFRDRMCFKNNSLGECRNINRPTNKDNIYFEKL